jgi:hypothetical protein
VRAHKEWNGQQPYRAKPKSPEAQANSVSPWVS